MSTTTGLECYVREIWAAEAARDRLDQQRWVQPGHPDTRETDRHRADTKPPDTLGGHMDSLQNRMEDLGLDPAPVEALRHYVLDRTVEAIASALEDE